MNRSRNDVLKEHRYHPFKGSDYSFGPTKHVLLETNIQLKVKMVVAARQFRKSHVDVHYASAVFRYHKEFCVKFRDITSLVCEDDKHTIKVGEPGFPVAAVERDMSLSA